MASLTYLLINIFSISIPLLNSFEPKVYFFGKWKALFPALLITGSVFIAWDVVFTSQGVWGFTPRYLLGINIGNLPLEEWLFFLVIPYASVFTYEALTYYVKEDYFGKWAPTITRILIIVLVLVAILNSDKIYTFTTCLFTATFLILHLFLKVNYLGRFYLAYLVILLPFSMVNGLLTGSLIEDQVVWYNNQENLSIRIGTIPIEDIFYGMLLILMNVTFYEFFKRSLFLNQKGVI